MLPDNFKKINQLGFLELYTNGTGFYVVTNSVEKRLLFIGTNKREAQHVIIYQFIEMIEANNKSEKH